ncbi:hypothetical protein niasHT_002029 [Heterodera trifolii]|uniref:Conserved oligomeric Golgi complex subunit 8 n=1 Tax=Heterodera trifolii TaxID=157864 RepID=A0ABD2M2K6_9BILA
MGIEEKMAVEKEFASLNFGEISSEKDRVVGRIQHLQNELSDLAFHNYRTYVDVGRTAEHCKEMFAQMNSFMVKLKAEFPDLIGCINLANSDSEKFLEEYELLHEVESISNIIWKVLRLPKLMDKYIRTGRYEQAYSLTNFAISLKQSKLTQKNAMLAKVVDVLIEARHNLLNELFSKFAGPIDLSRSIQIVNNIRKIPFISNIQLRESILQYRDIYMDKNIQRVMSESDFLLRAIDVYRECMYDTIVLYLAVFPDYDVQQRKFAASSEDPRWERWTGSSQNFLLHSWAQRNIERLFSLLRGTENKNYLDMEVMHTKVMSFAFSFGRMGLDFRPLVVNEFAQMILETCRRRVETATNCLTELKRLDLIDGDIFENTRQDFEDGGHQSIDLNVISAPLELCIWDDICVFGNLLIDILNDLRHSFSIILVRQVFGIFLFCLQNVCKWVDSFLSVSAEIVSAKRAISLLLKYFVPFFNRCFFHCFPHEKCVHFFRSSHCSVEDYRNAFKFRSKTLFVLCKHESVFNETLSDVQTNESDDQPKWQNEKDEGREKGEGGWERIEQKESEAETTNTLETVEQFAEAIDEGGKNEETQ